MGPPTGPDDWRLGLPIRRLPNGIILVPDQDRGTCYQVRELRPGHPEYKAWSAHAVQLDYDPRPFKGRVPVGFISPQGKTSDELWAECEALAEKLRQALRAGQPGSRAGVAGRAGGPAEGDPPPDAIRDT